MNIFKKLTKKFECGQCVIGLSAKNELGIVRIGHVPAVPQRQSSVIDDGHLFRWITGHAGEAQRLLQQPSAQEPEESPGRHRSQNAEQPHVERIIVHAFRRRSQFRTSSHHPGLFFDASLVPPPATQQEQEASFIRISFW